MNTNNELSVENRLSNLENAKSIIQCNIPMSVNKQLGQLPYAFYEGSAVVCNNEIHILGGDSGTTNHYKYNGTSWTSVSSLSDSFCDGSAVVYNNEIHILGSSGGQTSHYKYNGSSWTSVSTLPYNFYYGSAVVYNNEIHILGSYDSSNRTKHYKYNGSSWDNLLLLDRYYLNKDTIILIDNKSNMTIGSSNIESISDNSIKLLEDTYIDLSSSTEQLTFYS